MVHGESFPVNPSEKGVACYIRILGSAGCPPMARVWNLGSQHIDAIIEALVIEAYQAGWLENISCVLSCYTIGSVT